MKKRWFEGLWFCGIFLMGVLFSSGWGSDVDENGKIKAPYIEVPIINSDDKKEIPDSCKIGELREDGKYMIVLFWTTWCPHCIDAMWEMNTYAKAYSDKLTFCAVALDDERSVHRYVDKRDLSFPVAVDEKGLSAYLYRVMGVPTIVIISPDGNIWDYGYNLEWMVKRLIRKVSSA